MNNEITDNNDLFINFLPMFYSILGMSGSGFHFWHEKYCHQNPTTGTNKIAIYIKYIKNFLKKIIFKIIQFLIFF